MGYGFTSYGQSPTIYGGEKMTPEYIILHHSLTRDSETVSWNAIRKYHVQKLNFRNIGYHMGLEQIKDRQEILMGRMMNETGAHCRQSRMNHRSLGICFIGNFDKEKPPKEQWNLGLKLVSSLMYVFKIPKDKVLGHNHFAKYKTCPGKKFDADEFVKQLK